MHSLRGTLKAFSFFVLIPFTFNNIAFGAEALGPASLSITSRPSLSFEMPRSVAVVEDTWNASAHPHTRKLVYLIQDAHANDSAQFNLSKTLDALLKNEKDIRYVFVEAGAGDVSLSFFRKYSNPEKRKEAAASFLKKGLLHGEEYLDITSNRDFVLWGVEDISLYQKALESYRFVAEQREKFSGYLDQVESAAQALKSRLYSPSLLAFDEAHQLFLKEETPLIDYIETLFRQADKKDLSLKRFPHLRGLKKLKKIESLIDFKKANEEQARAIISLSPDAQKELTTLSSAERYPFKLSSQERKRGRAFYSLLEEQLGKEGGRYLELSKYFSYLKAARKVDLRKALAEEFVLESQIFDLLSATGDEKNMVRCARDLGILRKLINLTLTPEEFEIYKNSTKSSGFLYLGGFLNKKIMDLKSHYEKTIFIKEGFDQVIKHAEDFYRLTYSRDRVFVKNMFEKMGGAAQEKAVLITGGYHTANLKYLLKRENVSYISITPQVLHETNQKKYEKILLSQKFHAGFAGGAEAVPGGLAFDRARTSMARDWANAQVPGVVLRMAGSLGAPQDSVLNILKERSPAVWVEKTGMGAASSDKKWAVPGALMPAPRSASHGPRNLPANGRFSPLGQFTTETQNLTPGLELALKTQPKGTGPQWGLAGARMAEDTTIPSDYDGGGEINHGFVSYKSTYFPSFLLKRQTKIAAVIFGRSKAIFKETGRLLNFSYEKGGYPLATTALVPTIFMCGASLMLNVAGAISWFFEKLYLFSRYLLDKEPLPLTKLTVGNRVEVLIEHAKPVSGKPLFYASTLDDPGKKFEFSKNVVFTKENNPLGKFMISVDDKPAEVATNYPALGVIADHVLVTVAGRNKTLNITNYDPYYPISTDDPLALNSRQIRQLIQENGELVRSGPGHTIFEGEENRVPTHPRIWQFTNAKGRTFYAVTFRYVLPDESENASEEDPGFVVSIKGKNYFDHEGEAMHELFTWEEARPRVKRLALPKFKPETQETESRKFEQEEEDDDLSAALRKMDMRLIVEWSGRPAFGGSHLKNVGFILQDINRVNDIYFADIQEGRLVPLDSRDPDTLYDPENPIKNYLEALVQSINLAEPQFKNGKRVLDNSYKKRLRERIDRAWQPVLYISKEVDSKTKQINSVTLYVDGWGRKAEDAEKLKAQLLLYEHYKKYPFGHHVHIYDGSDDESLTIRNGNKFFKDVKWTDIDGLTEALNHNGDFKGIGEAGSRLASVQEAVDEINLWKGGQTAAELNSKGARYFRTRLQDKAREIYDKHKLFTLTPSERIAYVKAVFDTSHFKDVNAEVQKIRRALTSNEIMLSGEHLTPESYFELASRRSDEADKYLSVTNRNLRVADGLIFDLTNVERGVLQREHQINQFNIEMDNSIPAQGNVYTTITVQDIHGGSRRLLELIGFSLGLSEDIYTKVKTLDDLKRELAAAHIDPSRLNVRFVGFNDLSDRGDDPLGTYEIIRWLEETGKLKFFEGNHDDWRANGGLGIHEFFAKKFPGFNFEKKRQATHHIAYWAKDAFAHTGWGGIELDQINQKRFNAEVDRVNAELKKSGLPELARIDLSQERKRWDKELKRLKQINDKIRNREMEGEYLKLPDIFEQTLGYLHKTLTQYNRQIQSYSTPGIKIDAIRFDEVNLTNYWQDLEVARHTLWKLQHARRYYVDPYFIMHTHNTLPVDERGFDVDYRDLNGLAVLELYSDAIHDFFHGMTLEEFVDGLRDPEMKFMERLWNELGEKLKEINNWYSDRIADAKPEAYEEFLDNGGFSGLGIFDQIASQDFIDRQPSFLTVLGHNPRKKVKGPWIRLLPFEKTGTALIDEDLSQGYENRGAVLTVGRRSEGKVTGIRRYGFKASDSTKIEDLTFEDTQGLDPLQNRMLEVLHDGELFMRWYRFKALEEIVAESRILIERAKAAGRTDKEAIYITKRDRAIAQLQNIVNEVVNEVVGSQEIKRKIFDLLLLGNHQALDAADAVYWSQYSNLTPEIYSMIARGRKIADKKAAPALTGARLALRDELHATARRMVPPDGGILAADESTGTAGKRLAPLGLENTEANRQDMRRMMLTAPGQEKAGISSVILYKETFDNVDQDGNNLVQKHLIDRGILPIIKTDAGLIADPDSPTEMIPDPKGLEQLPALLKKYSAKGAVGTKWRTTQSIGEGLPTDANIRKNAFVQARQAKITQEAGLVPIVEPEVLLDGDHNIAASYQATTRTLSIVFEELKNAGVWPDGMILKTSMILSGNKATTRADSATVGFETLKGLLKTVPAEVPAIVFLSGGQKDDEANENLNAVSLARLNRFEEARDAAATELEAEGKTEEAATLRQLTQVPWEVSYSFGRGLQAQALKWWDGKPENFDKGQAAQLESDRATQKARLGQLHGARMAQISIFRWDNTAEPWTFDRWVDFDSHFSDRLGVYPIPSNLAALSNGKTPFTAKVSLRDTPNPVLAVKLARSLYLYTVTEPERQPTLPGARKGEVAKPGVITPVDFGTPITDVEDFDIVHLENTNNNPTRIIVLQNNGTTRQVTVFDGQGRAVPINGQKSVEVSLASSLPVVVDRDNHLRLTIADTSNPTTIYYLYDGVLMQGTEAAAQVAPGMQPQLSDGARLADLNTLKTEITLLQRSLPDQVGEQRQPDYYSDQGKPLSDFKPADLRPFKSEAWIREWSTLDEAAQGLKILAQQINDSIARQPSGARGKLQASQVVSRLGEMAEQLSRFQGARMAQIDKDRKNYHIQLSAYKAFTGQYPRGRYSIEKLEEMKEEKRLSDLLSASRESFALTVVQAVFPYEQDFPYENSEAMMKNGLDQLGLNEYEMSEEREKIIDALRKVVREHGFGARLAGTRRSYASPAVREPVGSRLADIGKIQGVFNDFLDTAYNKQRGGFGAVIKVDSGLPANERWTHNVILPSEGLKIFEFKLRSAKLDDKAVKDFLVYAYKTFRLQGVTGTTTQDVFVSQILTGARLAEIGPAIVSLKQNLDRLQRFEPSQLGIYKEMVDRAQRLFSDYYSASRPDVVSGAHFIALQKGLEGLLVEFPGARVEDLNAMSELKRFPTVVDDLRRALESRGFVVAGARLAEPSLISLIQSDLKNPERLNELEGFMLGEYLALGDKLSGQTFPLLWDETRSDDTPLFNLKVSGSGLVLSSNGQTIHAIDSLDRATQTWQRAHSARQQRELQERGQKFLMMNASKLLNEILPPMKEVSSRGIAEIDLGQISRQVPSDAEFDKIFQVLADWTRLNKKASVYFSGIASLPDSRRTRVQIMINNVILNRKEDQGIVTTVYPKARAVVRLYFADPKDPEFKSVERQDNEAIVFSAGFDQGLPNLIVLMRLLQEAAYFYGSHASSEGKLPTEEDEVNKLVQDLQPSALLRVLNFFSQDRRQALDARTAFEAMAVKIDPNLIRRIMLGPIVKFLDDRLRALQTMLEVAHFA